MKEGNRKREIKIKRRIKKHIKRKKERKSGK